MKRLAVFMLLVITAFLSGCTVGDNNQNAADASTGLKVDYVQTSWQYVKSGDTITIDAKVTNNGDRNIERVVMKPILLPWQGFDGVRDCPPLQRPRTEINRVGGSCYGSWPSVKVPRVTKQETFDVGVRFYYDYATEMRAKVFAISGREYDNYMERGEIPRTATFESSKGPIEVSISIDNVIIIPTSGNRRVPVTLKFHNDPLTGFPQSYNAVSRNYEISSVTLDEESSATGGIRVSDWGTCARSVPMRGGSDGECLFWLDVSDSTTDEVVIDLKIVSEYTYAIVGKTPITVNPSIEDEYN